MDVLVGGGTRVGAIAVRMLARCSSLVSHRASGSSSMMWICPCLAVACLLPVKDPLRIPLPIYLPVSLPTRPPYPAYR